MNPIQFAINTIKDIANSESKLYFAGNDQSDPTVDVNNSDIPTYTDVTSIVKAEECFELPPVVNLTEELDDSIVEQLISSINMDGKLGESIEVLATSPKSPKTANNAKKKNFSTIGNTEFSDVIVHSSKTNKRGTASVIDNPQPGSSKSDRKTTPVPVTTTSFRYDYT